VLKQSRGFSIVELMVAVALMALLLGLAAPSFTTWNRNAQIRTVSDALQNGLRTAQAEALRRQRQVVFFRTAATACSNTISASTSGNFWAIRTVPIVAGDPVETVQCGMLSDVAAGVVIDGPVALCFNSSGRQTTNTSPGIGGSTCTLDASGTSQFDVSVAAGDRPLRVTVSLGGSVRMCDPARSRSSASPDGCS
jgi:type IV fimbrial biogenesis protein FimT